MRERAGVLGEEHRSGPDLPRQPDRLGHGLPAADGQATQRVAQIPQRLAEEGEPVGSAEAVEDGLVEDEERQHALGLFRRGGERRVVVDSQVAREEDDRGAHRSKR